MAYCKHCVCGHVTVYEKKGGAPLRCPKCSRFIAAVTEELYTEPREEPKTAGTPESREPDRKPPETPEIPKTEAKGFFITLESPEGEFVLPVRERITVGRNASGMSYLEPYADVSREHFTIEPRFNGISATLTDISTFGTYVNGVRMVKGSSVAVSNSTVLRLANNAILIVRVKEAVSDA